jgi:RimJ/RimL family protein N-acetyltransferase
MNLSATTLRGRFVQLEPVETHHRTEMAEPAADSRIWENTPLGPSFDHYFDTLLKLRADGRQIPFAVRWIHTNTIIGGSRLMDIVPEHHRLEIGGTWYHPHYWGGPANAESKLLLLTHAFEHAGAFRVQLLTDQRNAHSQAAIAKLGARREGVVRSHMLVAGGRRRDSVMFSIVEQEWPTVKARLEERLRTD